jgi:hypothetical protein
MSNSFLFKALCVRLEEAPVVSAVDVLSQAVATWLFVDTNIALLLAVGTSRPGA